MTTITKSTYVAPSAEEIRMKYRRAICDYSGGDLDDYSDGGDLGSDVF